MMMNRAAAETLHAALEAMAMRLAPFSDTPQLDAQVLIAHVLNQPRSWLLAHDDQALNAQQAGSLDDLVRRLEQAEPLPYVIGHWEFFGLDFELTPDVLIPRPETELLLERAIPWLQSSQRPSLADIGTGCGCIAVCLAAHVPGAHILATDISSAALEVAKRNARKHRVENQIEFIECDILPHSPSPSQSGMSAGVPEFDLICANLPYIPTSKLRTLPIYGREPTLALDGGEDGLAPLRKLLQLAPTYLKPGGRLLLEIEATRGPAALSLAYDAFEEAEIHLYQDLAQQDRLLEIQLPLQ